MNMCFFVFVFFSDFFFFVFFSDKNPNSLPTYVSLFVFFVRFLFFFFFLSTLGCSCLFCFFGSSLEPKALLIAYTTTSKYTFTHLKKNTRPIQEEHESYD